MKSNIDAAAQSLCQVDDMLIQDSSISPKRVADGSVNSNIAMSFE